MYIVEDVQKFALLDSDTQYLDELEDKNVP
jgi:hypothetical protein